MKLETLFFARLFLHSRFIQTSSSSMTMDLPGETATLCMTTNMLPSGPFLIYRSPLLCVTLARPHPIL